PIVEPEDFPVTRGEHRGNSAQNVIYLAQHDLTLDTGRAGCTRIGNKCIHLCQFDVNDSSAMCLRILATEIIIGYVGGSYFQHAEECIRMLRLEITKHAATILTNL